MRGDGVGAVVLGTAMDGEKKLKLVVLQGEKMNF